MTSSITRGGFEPLPEAGEFVCDCYEHGTGEPWAHVGSSHVHERIVRCRDCIFCEEDVTTVGINGDEIATGSQCEWLGLWVKPNGFCAWGVQKEDA